MQTIGSYELKTHLAEILERVERGEEVLVTRRGKAVARILPPEKDTDSADAAFAAMQALRAAQQPMSWKELRELRDEGRR